MMIDAEEERRAALDHVAELRDELRDFGSRLERLGRKLQEEPERLGAADWKIWFHQRQIHQCVARLQSTLVRLRRLESDPQASAPSR